MANNYDAIINGVEFAIDYGLQVSDEDWNAYQKAIKMRKRKGENLQNSSRIIVLPLYFNIDSRYTNEVSVYKLCLLRMKDFTLLSFREEQRE